MMRFDSIAGQLERTGLCVQPEFLDADSLRALGADLEALHKAQGFHRAGTGQGSGKEVRDQVRRDEVCWLERGDATPAQARLWLLLDGLQQSFNRKLYLGLREFEGHYARYPAGGFYKRHLDCFKQDNGRVVSVILYLNSDWQPSHGGQLRIYGDEAPLDVEPRGGTLVCFLSAEREHEVLPSRAERLSFTGWFKRQRS